MTSRFATLHSRPKRNYDRLANVCFPPIADIRYSPQMTPLVSLLVAASATQLTPQDPRTGAVATGNEQRACLSWTRAQRAHSYQRRLDEKWFWGLVTGFDLAGWRSDVEKLVWPSDTPSDFLAYFDRYCAKHPKRRVIDAVAALHQHLCGNRK